MGESAEAIATQKRLAATVAAWIEACGLNPTEIQKQTGLGRQTVYRVLNGKAGTTIDTLTRLASVFGDISAAGLLAGELPTRARSALTVSPDVVRQLRDQLESPPGSPLSLAIVAQRVDLLTRTLIAFFSSTAEHLETDLGAPPAASGPTKTRRAGGKGPRGR